MRLIRLRLLVSLFALAALPAAASLTVTPVTWNIIGLDSNDPLTGPEHFPIGARVCSDAATTNVAVNYLWDSANAFVNLRAGSPSTINIASIGAGSCADAYFEVAVTKNAAAFDTVRRYHITATDFSGTVSTPTPRELYVEHLISQSRNAISDVKVGTTVPGLVSVPAGGAMNLVVGNTYLIQLLGGTATQGYNQFEAFINFPNTIFQVLDVETTYSANDSPYVTGPFPAIHDKLYADACLWENDPNSPSYRACVGGDFKSGGSNVITTYTIKIIGGGGTSQALNTLLYDFSGSSFHYNADYATGARIANVIDPTTATISKSFSPNPASINGVSALTFTLTNPNAGSLSGYNFVDNLPANLVVATPNGATTSGCGTPSLTAVASSSTISFSNGTLAANSNCVIKVDVTPTATGTLNNTTSNLFIDTTDTGDNASASLTVNNEPPPGTGLCGLTLAGWTFPAGFSVTSPAPSTNNVASATAKPGDGITSTSFTEGTNSWGSNGDITTGATLVLANEEYVELAVDTTGYTSGELSFQAARKNTPNSPRGIAVYKGSTSLTTDSTEGNGSETGTLILAANATALPLSTTAFSSFGPISFTPENGISYIRIYFFNSGNVNSGSDISVDNVTVNGCASAVKPTLTKGFSPDPIAVNAVSTLTFTLTNTNASSLTGAAFTDSLPAGVQVAATPAASTTCGGTWAPAAAATSLTFSNGTIPASSSCTVSVNVTATTAGPHGNVSGVLSTTESGTTTTSVATDTLTAVLPPVIAKQFAPTPILANGTSTLTFTITNPNQNDALSGVAFSDTFPVAPGAMVVAAVPNASASGCGSPTFNPLGGAGAISFSGGSLSAGGTCIVEVDVTAPTVGTYNNTSGNVSHIINAATVNGNTASDSLQVSPPSPSIGLYKEVGTSLTGPWTTFLAINSGNVFYRFTIENTGDVPLNPISLTDDTLNVATCNATLASMTLPVAVAANDNHITTCVVGPVAVTSGSHTNTAHATGTFSGTPYDSDDATATYATTGVTLDKTAAQATFASAGNSLNYSYLVTNSGFAPLEGPVTVADDKATVTCPAVSTVGDLDNFLDPGESVTCTATYIVVAGDVTAAFVTNTATATVDGINSNSDSVTVFLATSADISVVKTLTTVGPFTAGQSISYSLLIANAGPSTATNIQVTDTPTNLTITTVSGSGCAALPCTIPSLASGANTSITVTATITAPGAFDNSTTVDADEPDPDPTDNTDNTGNGGLTGASADISVVKTLVTTGPYVVGQSISYTLFVANAGPSTATNIQVTDTPSNLTITTVSGSGCAALPCIIASLASGANTTINVTATINATGAFDNVATVDADEPDPDPSDNTDNAGNGGTAGPSADVSVVKTLVTGGPFADGQSISYTLFVANAGPSTATSIDVIDTPSNLTITAVSGACASLPCTIASLASGADATINVTATINSIGAFDNTTTVAADEPDPDPSDNTDNSGNGGTATAEADISVVKTLDTAGPYFVAQSVTYTLLVANAGPSTANNILVTDTPANLTITGVSGSGCAALPCTIASLASGTNTTINVTATINATGAFDNVVTVDADEPDPETIDNTDDAGNGGNAGPSADISVVKTLTTVGPFTAGQSISYSLLIANAGPSTATNIQVTDTPTNLTIDTVSGSGCANLPCIIPSLASGANTSITLSATIVATGAFDNVVTVDADEPDPDTTDNTDDAGNGGNAGPSADISVVKTLTTVGPFTAAQSISYSLLIANAGPSTANNIQVTDTPSNLTITGVSGACASLPCTIASLASGANTSITVTATINGSGAFDNVVTVDADEPDPDTTDNTDDAGNGGNAGPSADISVVKTLTTAGPFTAGQSISYSLLIANAGPSTANNIQVTDTPTNLTITGVSGACASLPCTIASLASGANTSITVTATITAPGAFDNVVTVDADEPDPDTTDNTDNAGNGGVTGVSADISVVKTLTTAGPWTIGQTVSYTLLVANAGPSTATNIQVTDTPTNLTITGVSGACATLPCTIASLASGANVTINVAATINTAGAFDNVATVDGVEPDPDPSDDTDDDGNGGTADPLADMAITKTLATAGPYSNGQSISYAFVVTNNGPSPATNVQITDTPSNLTITGVSGACASLPCTIASMAPSATASFTVTATIDGSPFDNVTTVDANEPDPDTSNNTDDDGNGGLIGVSADVSVVKTLTTAGPFTAGQSISYTLLVANAGPSPATNIQVTDTPTNLTITSVSGACAALPCTIASLASGANTTITVTATINASGAFDNVATVDGDEPDPDPSDDTDDDGNGGTAAPPTTVDVAITKTASVDVVRIGDTFDYTLVIVNNGPSTATGTVVTDPLPPNFELVSATSTQGSCTGTTTATCTIGTMLNGASVTITIRGRVTYAASLENIATVTVNESEADVANNASGVSPAIAASDIPTATETGLMLLVLMLGLAGVFVMRGRV